MPAKCNQGFHWIVLVAKNIFSPNGPHEILGMVYAFRDLWIEVEEESSTMISGKVKWFNDTKGYGFIELAQGKDVFVHYSVIESDGYRSLREGQQVAFELENGPKGDHATKVVAAEPLTAAA